MSEATATESRPKLSVTVEKPTPYTFDLGLLLANDPNPLEAPSSPSKLEDTLRATARDGTQALINQLLTAVPITSTPAGVLLTLPPRTTPLPREKPVPAAKPPTKWEQFAARRGIKPKTREQRRNAVYDEATGKWERKWGYKGANKAGENDWLVEVDMKKEAERKEGTSVRGDGRRERKERVKRNERLMRKNQRQTEGRR